MKTLLVILFLLVMNMKLYAQQSTDLPKLPALDKMEVIDTLHGVVVHDPYRGLEDTDNPQVLAWLKHQGKYADSLLKQQPIYDTLQKELIYYQGMADYKISFPIAVDSTLFFVKKSVSNANQQLIMRQGYESSEKVLYETSDQTIEFFSPSPTKEHIAIALTSQGKEISTLYIYDIKHKALLKDSIPRNLLSLPEWLGDGNGFFYQQLSNTQNTKDRFLNSQVKLHFLGTPETNDQVILSSQTNDFIQPTNFPYIHLYPQSNQILAAIYEGTSFHASLYVANLQDIINKKSVQWRRVTQPDDQVTHFALTENSLYLLTSKYKESGEIVAISTTSLSLEQRKRVVYLDSAIIDGFLLTQDGLYIKSIDKGISNLHRYDLESKKLSEIDVPIKGKITINDFQRPITYMNMQGMLFGAESWTQPYGLYYYNPEIKKTIVIDLGFNEKYDINLVIEQVEVAATDGMVIPLTIIYPKGMNKNKNNPALLFAYGAYGLSVEPTFSPLFTPWYKRGGIFAVAHVRGGGEKGEQWHQAGQLANKPNSWKDYIACAKYLEDHRYTSASKLAAYGASAGGITIGRAVTEAPTSFGAAVIKVGVVNPLRFEEGNTANVTEFGSYKDSAQFSYLLAMDSYQNVKPGINYPPILFTAGLNDNRVAAWQPAKMVARLQDENPSSTTLFYIKEHGGHFTGPNLQAVDEHASMFTFLFWQLCGSSLIKN